MRDLLLPFAGVLAAVVAVIAGWLWLRADRLAEDPQAEHRRRRLRGPGTGVVLAVATLAGTFGVGWPGTTALPLLAVALLLGGTGFLADRRRLRPSARVGAEAAAGLVAVMVGLETEITALELTNTLLVVGFVVIMVESVRLLDSAPRAAAVVTAPVVIALAYLAHGSAQIGTGLLAAGLAGGMVGLVAAGTRRPFWLGESGALFSGFLLAVLLIDVVPSTPAPASLAVLSPLAAIPLLNTLAVVIDRLRRRRPLTQRRPDGFGHRLRAVGLSWSVALGLLGGLQIGVATAVVLADREVVPLVVPPLIVGAVALSLILLAPAGRVHKHKAAGTTWGVRLGGVALLALVGVLVVPAGLALLSARAGLNEGALAVDRGLKATAVGDVETAAEAFDQAHTAFAAASERLETPVATPGLAVPVLGPNLASVRTISTTAVELTGTGAAVAATAPKGLSIVGGRAPLEELRKLEPELAAAAGSLRGAQITVDELERAYLLPLVRNSVEEFDDQLRRAADDADIAAQALAILPEILGGNGPRRYFVMVQNNAELRATGGFMGNYGVLVAEDGRLRLEHIGKPQQLNEAGPPVKVLDAPEDYQSRYGRFEVANSWQNVNFSPDLPTVGRVIAGLYPQSGGTAIDGVIAIDPVGLAGLLRLTQPIEVAPWSTPITSDNVVDVTLNQAYVEFDDNDDRIDFLGDVAGAAIDAFSRTDLGGPARIFDALGKPAHGGHLAAWFVRPEEQALADRANFATRVTPVTSDSLLVINQNAAGNKTDFYLRRALTYEAQLRPVGDELRISGRLRVDMENQAPSEGLPRYIIGPYDDRFEAGENRSYVSVYSPLDLVGARWGGETLPLEEERELGRNVYSAFLSLPAGRTNSLELELEGTLTSLPGGWYELDLLHQPLLVPEHATVKIEVADGWRIAEVEGATLSDDRRAITDITLDRNASVRLRLEPEG
ncbi:MAG TPA: DUF4012 domain-containing protein [Acidimicrobiales bacterium]|nr:DUF4012 domain-containing protein [Acidimicrobiales bacterium]